ncbi:hypothetical protein [Pusillimonas sp.]|uniref:hypothetical protein n=1 Tax=Pusillimonas sp. TaxID=3040095 RepID=UPI0029B6FDF2|nr:hypothetical protein [Pusillimonas sp.]MDX3894456.1 hypothetical protein [Pusillimonas sp.]
MIPFEYLKPRSIAEAIGMLQPGDPDFRPTNSFCASRGCSMRTRKTTRPSPRPGRRGWMI